MSTRVLLVLLSLLMPASQSEPSRLLWSDEFNLSAGAPPDPTKWVHDVGGGGWGNRELENYTIDTRNAAHDGKGHLIIRAMRGPDGSYTSARLKTLRKFEWQYGKVEARIKVPSGKGLWPAFWMLGNDFPEVGWDKCGEIDVMEHVGREPSTVYGTVHGPGYSGKDGISGNTMLSQNRRFADDFHVFGVIWREKSIEFLLDGRSYARVTPDRLPRGARWVFDHPFFMLLNLAIGGDWPGNPDSTSAFPQQMVIDWIRVWGR